MKALTPKAKGWSRLQRFDDARGDGYYYYKGNYFVCSSLVNLQDLWSEWVISISKKSQDLLRADDTEVENILKQFGAKDFTEGDSVMGIVRVFYKPIQH